MMIKSIYYVELYVGNSFQACQFYRTVMGFAVVAYRGPETGFKDEASFLVQRGHIRILLTSPVTTHSNINNFLQAHGEGVHDIAFEVDDSRRAFAGCIDRSARAACEPWEIEDKSGKAVLAQIKTFGDAVHTLVQKINCDGVFLPGFRSFEQLPLSDIGLTDIDHFAISVDRGTLESWVEHYGHVFGFRTSREESITTDYSAMSSIVTESLDRRVVLVFVEPAEGKRLSPIAEYLTYFGGPGVHHVAFRTRDIVSAVKHLAQNGVPFGQTPQAYYDALPGRVGTINQSLEELRELGVLVDRDSDGYLMQIFTKPMQSRPTLSYELIQREGAQGFGSGNIKALFEAIERAQLERGNS